MSIFGLSRGLAALALSFTSLPAFACGCIQPIDLSRFEEVARNFEISEDVFSASVVSVRSLDEPDAVLRTGEDRAELRVLQVWKGSNKPGQRLTIVTRNNSVLMNCAMEPAAGQALMVYGHLASLNGISICSLSGSLARAIPDLPALHQLAHRDPAVPLFRGDHRFSETPPWLPEPLFEIYLLDSDARSRARR